LALSLGVSIGSAQAPPASGNPAAYVAITLPVGVRSETLFVRYVLDNDFGGWLEPHPGVSSYFISTKRRGTPASRFKALVYAPGCQIQTVDLLTEGPAVPRYSFVCEPLRNVTLTGTLMKPDRLDGRELNVQVKYVARWAQQFFGLGEGILTDIPLGGIERASAKGSFQLSLPDLSADPLAGTSDHPGELQLLGKDPISGKIVAQIVPAVQFLRTRMGGLKIRKDYPVLVEFAPCSSARHSLEPHDPFGFAIRTDSRESIDACNQ
jgi:hypothetical protein